MLYIFLYAKIEIGMNVYMHRFEKQKTKKNFEGFRAARTNMVATRICGQAHTPDYKNKVPKKR